MVGEQAVLDDASQIHDQADKAKRAGGWIIIASVLVVTALLALLLALALRPRRPAPPPYQVAPIQAGPPRAWIGDDPVPLPIPVALEVAGRALPVQPALLISDTWTIQAADAGVAYWSIWTYTPYRIAVLDGGIFQALQTDAIIILQSSGGEFRFAIAGEPPPGPRPGLIISLLGGGSIWADALQAEIPVPPVPTSTPTPTPTPAPWPEVEIISATLEADGAHLWVQVRNIGGGILEVREGDIGPGLLLASPPLPWVVRREVNGELVFEWPCGSINILGWQYEVNYAGE